MTPPASARCTGRHAPKGHCPDELCRAGEVVGHYVLGRCLGRGGMGIVYEARHATLDRRFAIKFLRPELSGRTEIQSRFQREARAAGALESEHLVAAVDLDRAPDGTPYLVMEYVDGENLAELLQRTGPLSVPRAVSIMLEACRGACAAHRAGIVHRDLKPQNLFVCQRSDGTDRVKILDFGIAKLDRLEPEDATVITSEGQLLGTPAYMAPEQARGVAELDERVDVYALGAIAYELLSGSRAHPGRTRNDVLYHVLTQPVTPLAALRPDLPERLCAAVDRALRTDPAERTPSARELAGQLERFARPSAGAASDPTSALETAPDTAATLVGPASVGARRRMASLALSVLALVPLVAWGVDRFAFREPRSSLRDGMLSSELFVLTGVVALERAERALECSIADRNTRAVTTANFASKSPAQENGRRAAPSPTRDWPTQSGVQRSVAASGRHVPQPGSLSDDIYKP